MTGRLKRVGTSLRHLSERSITVINVRKEAHPGAIPYGLGGFDRKRRFLPLKVLSRLLTAPRDIPGFRVVNSRLSTLEGYPLVYRRVYVIPTRVLSWVSLRMCDLCSFYTFYEVYAPPSGYTLGCCRPRGGFDDSSRGVDGFPHSLCKGALCSGFPCFILPVSRRVRVYSWVDLPPDLPWASDISSINLSSPSLGSSGHPCAEVLSVAGLREVLSLFLN